MADFTGITTESKQASRFTPTLPDVAPTNVTIDGTIGTLTKLIHAQFKTEYDGYTDKNGESSGFVIFNKIYVFPTSIDFGFITEELQEKITIWNSGTTNAANATVSAIQKINDNGLGLDNDTPPFNLRPQCAIENTVTAFLVGPAVQNTTYIYTINGVDYVVTVVGKRIVAFPFEPNWQPGVELTLKFQTILSKNKRFIEQRRALYDNPVFEQRADFLCAEEAQQIFKQVIRNINNRVLAVPVYDEAIIPTQDLQGLQTISVQDISEELYLNDFAQFVILMRKEKTDITTEIKEIQSLTANTITFENAVVEEFNEDETIIYPAIISTMRLDETQVTAETLNTTITFREVFV